jgi:hypothetical protein
MKEKNGVTLKDIKPLTKLYNKAILDNKSSFLFKDIEIDVGYAKYLLMYIKGVQIP